MTFLRIIVGLLLLTLGYQLFWLFVSGVGFVTALSLTEIWAEATPTWLTLIIALFVGLIGALIAVFLQEFAVGLAGFLAGGSVALGFARILEIHAPAVIWILAGVGAFTGLVLAVVLFDWAVIILSSLSGALMIAQSFNISQPVMLLVTAITFTLGFVTQLSWMQKNERRRYSAN
ncbi:MAG: DUF4203 domain-containing protein [Anaerolineae bacterium]|nr:DUF4203 domain-containing protein [Anaerolineae bacterium]